MKVGLAGGDEECAWNANCDLLYEKRSVWRWIHQDKCVSFQLIVFRHLKREKLKKKQIMFVISYSKSFFSKIISLSAFLQYF